MLASLWHCVLRNCCHLVFSKKTNFCFIVGRKRDDDDDECTVGRTYWDEQKFIEIALSDRRTLGLYAKMKRIFQKPTTTTAAAATGSWCQLLSSTTCMHSHIRAPHKDLNRTHSRISSSTALTHTTIWYFSTLLLSPPSSIPHTLAAVVNCTGMCVHVQWYSVAFGTRVEASIVVLNVREGSRLDRKEGREIGQIDFPLCPPPLPPPFCFIRVLLLACCLMRLLCSLACNNLLGFAF